MKNGLKILLFFSIFLILLTSITYAESESLGMGEAITVYVIRAAAPSPKCGDIIGSSYTMTSDLTNSTGGNICPGDGLIIYANNITFDCNGHSITGSGIDRGIDVWYSLNIVVKNCVISNFDYGIDSDTSNYNTLSKNNVSENTVGVRLGDSNYSVISDNYISENRYPGYGWGVLFFESNNNTIENNTLFDNYCGIWLQQSSDNTVFHNNLINNSLQLDELGSNYWYNSTLLEGNYWSDYIGLDDGSGTGKHSIAGDGIGDTLIPFYGRDDYPFMNPNLWLNYASCNCTELKERVSDLEKEVEELKTSFQSLNNTVQNNTQRIGILESIVNGLQSLVKSIQDMLNKIIGCTGTQTCVSGGNCTAGCPGGCQNKCVGSVRYFNGNCNLTSCGCSWSTEDCSLQNGWYNTTTTQWVNATPSTEKEQVNQESRDYTCSVANCTYSVNNTRWADTGRIRNKAIIKYCSAATNSQWNEYIARVSLNGSSKSSGRSTYSNFTDTLFTALNAGTSYNLSVDVSTSGNYTEYVKSWIDYNNDGIFSSDEGIDLGSAKFYGNRTFNKTFTVPINATVTETRMRVYLKWSAAPSPCENASFGEVEDYKVSLLSP